MIIDRGACPECVRVGGICNDHAAKMAIESEQLRRTYHKRVEAMQAVPRCAACEELRKERDDLKRACEGEFQRAIAFGKAERDALAARLAAAEIALDGTCCTKCPDMLAERDAAVQRAERAEQLADHQQTTLRLLMGNEERESQRADAAEAWKARWHRAAMTHATRQHAAEARAGQLEAALRPNALVRGYLPTPTTRPDAQNRGSNKVHGPTSLAEAVGLQPPAPGSKRAARQLPTPNARDWKGPPGAGTQERDGRHGSLPAAVLPTPRARDWKGKGKNCLPPAGADGLRLNPRFVEWMMGLPPGWTETASSSWGMP